jgi:hypothetical protein
MIKNTIVYCNKCKQPISNYSGIEECGRCLLIDDNNWWIAQHFKTDLVKHFKNIALPNYYAMTSGIKDDA